VTKMNFVGREAAVVDGTVSGVGGCMRGR
jgi:hypothetical protein